MSLMTSESILRGTFVFFRILERSYLYQMQLLYSSPMPRSMGDISVSLSMMVLRTVRPMLAVAAIAVLFDQLAKAIVRRTVATGNTIEVVRGYFEISYAENTGAAFGMFRGRNNIFIVISFAAFVFIFAYYRQFRESIWMKISLGLLLGGALGNLIDRIVFQHVTDFIRVRWWFLHLRWWPAFNIADASVCVGAAMLIVGMLKRGTSMRSPGSQIS